MRPSGTKEPKARLPPLSVQSLRVLGVIALTGALAACAWAVAGPADCGPNAPPEGREIFSGITQGCKELAADAEGRGAIHWVRVDLSAPGLELYVTPVDPRAVKQGFQYRLRWLSTVARTEKLAVVINGTMFGSVPTWRPRLPGDLANGLETVVANRVVSHLWEHTHLLWFDEQLAPALEISSPPSSAVLAAAKWGIGGQSIGLHQGRLSSSNGRVPNARTAIAIDRDQKLLFLGVGAFVSPNLILATLAELGAKDGMLLDGGGSTSMAISSPEGVPKVLFAGWRPVATQLGVRARPLSRQK